MEDLQSARNEARHDDCVATARKVPSRRTFSPAGGHEGTPKGTPKERSPPQVVEKEPHTRMFVYHGTEAECHCGRHASEPDLVSTLAACDRALGIRKEPHLLCDRAEAHIDSQDFDAGMVIMI